MKQPNKYGYGELIISTGGLIIGAVAMLAALTIYFAIPSNIPEAEWRQSIAAGAFLISYISGMVSYHHSANHPKPKV